MTHVAVITPTRNRKPLLPLIERWVRRQSLSHTWIVVEDSPTRSTHISPDTYVHRKEIEDPGCNTLARNLHTAIQRIPEHATHIAFMEDDDWYHKDYLSECVQDVPCAFWRTVHHCAEFAAYRIMSEPQRRMAGPLCTTVLPRKQLPVLKDVVRNAAPKGKHTVDLRLWQRLNGAGIPSKHLNWESLPVKGPYHVSFKRFPGDGIQSGYTVFQRRRSYPHKDPGRKTLIEHIGEEDYELYRPFLRD